MSNFTDYKAHIGQDLQKLYKTTLFQGKQLMLGMNCLEPGQIQKVHTHADQDKFYYVIEGVGRFTVDGLTRSLAAGSVVWAPAGIAHGVESAGPERLVLLVGMAPAPPQ